MEKTRFLRRGPEWICCPGNRSGPLLTRLVFGTIVLFYIAISLYFMKTGLHIIFFSLDMMITLTFSVTTIKHGFVCHPKEFYTVVNAISKNMH